jgi:hypothetical protein
MDKRSKKKTTLSPLNLDQIKLQCPPPLNVPPIRHPIFNSSPYLVKDGMVFGLGTSLGKELVNLQRENPKKNKCELLKQQIQNCMETDFFCNHLFESYLRQCSL